MLEVMVTAPSVVESPTLAFQPQNNVPTVHKYTIHTDVKVSSCWLHMPNISVSRDQKPALGIEVP